VDDDHGHLRNMLNDDILDKYCNVNVPPHKLKLKVNDICFIIRNLNVSEGISNNTRVRILKIDKYRIRCQTLDTTSRPITLPRIKFKFRLRYKGCFELTRTQFPLRLAYAISINKSQGQEYDKVVFDIRNQPFQHGHSYVAKSRVTSGQGMALYVKQEDIQDGVPILHNVVYDDKYLNHS
jgi:hypothetical protein